MVNKGTKVTAGEVVSSTRKYSNVDDTTRVFNIKADVNIQNGKVANINEGSLNLKDSDAYKNANFSCGQNMSYFAFNSNGLTMTEIQEAVTAILTFITDVDKNVESLNEEE